MKKLFLAAMIAAHLLDYADTAILGAAEHGQKKVLLVFGNAPVEQVEDVAAALRARGYLLDEQTGLLNPQVIKVLRLQKGKIQ